MYKRASKDDLPPSSHVLDSSITHRPTCDCMARFDKIPIVSHNFSMGKARLDQLLKQKFQLEARIKSETAKVRTQQRKDDTRRKIIAGAIALQNFETKPDSEFAHELLSLLDRYVVKPKERELFGLPPLPPQEGDDAPELKPAPPAPSSLAGTMRDAAEPS